MEIIETPTPTPQPTATITPTPTPFNLPDHLFNPPTE
ncbi:hypothetical protein UFOVP187_42 [uncultured Caudovirales phage]|uniref:Uncharacterized protein n=1 Tax=uncultured Caudovirales phage TaxID=2100421 RepID=A0A6J7WMS4_9CAUD|nr:hypothetical protein UFOVP187_42 [uncultured Caudovirales phage]